MGELNEIELKELYGKVKGFINDYDSYHVWYSVGCDEDWRPDGTYVSFEIHGHSDQGEGADWDECGSVSCDGTIYIDGETYKNFEEFKSNFA